MNVLGVPSSSALLAAMAVATWHAPARAQGSGDLLDLARAGHRAACESIRTISATVVMDSVFPTHAPWMRCAYWRSAGMVRISNGDPKRAVDDYLMDGSEIRQLGRSAPDPRGRRGYVASRKPPSDFFCECDLEREMLFTIPGPNGGQYDLDQFLRFAKETPKASRSDLGGNECIRVRMAFDTTTGLATEVTLWFDLERNYLVRKLEASYPGDTSRGEVEILEFLEAVPGVYVPVKCRRRSFRGRKLQQERVTTLEDLHVNGRIPRGIFDLPSVPAGTILKDWIKGESYAINQDWHRIGPATPLSRITSAGLADAGPAEYRTQSTSAARPLSSWILPLALVLAVGAGAACVYRRYRRGSP